MSNDTETEYPNWHTDDDWTLPDWMEPYRDMICNTGGNSIEELLTDRTTNGATNSIRSALIIAVESQVTMLYRMRREGML